MSCSKIQIILFLCYLFQYIFFQNDNFAVYVQAKYDFYLRFTLGRLDGFQNWKQLKKKPRLDEKTLRFHSKRLIELVGKSFVAPYWDSYLVHDIEELALVLEETADFLRGHSQAQKESQASLHPARQVLKLLSWSNN